MQLLLLEAANSCWLLLSQQLSKEKSIDFSLVGLVIANPMSAIAVVERSIGNITYGVSAIKP